MAERFIWIIRHGKSAVGDIGMRDFDRPLNGRGKRDGEKMQAWISEAAHPPEWVWVSPATRAKQTAQFVGAACNPELTTADTLYLALPEKVLDVLSSTPPQISSVGVVAHNPGLTLLANELGKEPVTDNLPTWGTALFCTTLDWPELRMGGADLIGLCSPKLLRDEKSP